MNHHVVELGAVYGLNKTDDLYFFDAAGNMKCGGSFNAVSMKLKYGYEIPVGGFLAIVPQVGIAYNAYLAADASKGGTGTRLANTHSLSALGAVSLFLSLAITRRTFFLYLGLNLCFGGILSIILSFSLFNLTFHKIWPIGMIFSGVTLFPCGYFSFHKCKKSYIFPSVVLTLLGLLFSLFSFDVITESFSKIVTLWWPIALILLGSVLITVFVIQKKNQASFPFINDDEELDYYVGSGDEL